MHKALFVPHHFKSLHIAYKSLSNSRKRQLIFLFLLSCVSAVSETLNIGIILPFLDYVNNGPAQTSQQVFGISISLTYSQHLFLLTSALCAVICISTLLRIYALRYQLRLGSLITSDTGKKVFEAVLCEPYIWHVTKNSSEILAYLSKDVDQLSLSIQAFLVFVVNLVFVLCLGVYLIALSPVLILSLAALLSSFYVFVYLQTRKTLAADGENLRESYQSSIKFAQEAIGGIRDIIIGNHYDFFVDRYVASDKQYRKSIQSINFKTHSPRFLIEGFTVMLIAIVAVSFALSSDGFDTQLPLLGAVTLAAYRILQPIQQCFNSFGILRSNTASFQKISPFLTNDKRTSYATYSVKPNLGMPVEEAPSNLIDLQSISYRYPNSSRNSLNNVSIRIDKGDCVAFVGETGSGKSTCCDVILGLIKPQSGLLLISGSDPFASSYGIDSWHQNISFVPQFVYLADTSIASNIAFGLPEPCIDMDRVKWAASKAYLTTFIASLPQQYNTLIGERGTFLSGGQRQRIGIARALYREAKVLVLDEATSALDNIVESKVMDSINPRSSIDNTIIMVSHRLSTIQNCNKIYLFSEGSILASGTYDHLVSSSPQFRELSRNMSQANTPGVGT